MVEGEEREEIVEEIVEEDNVGEIGPAVEEGDDDGGVDGTDDYKIPYSVHAFQTNPPIIDKQSKQY